MSDGRCARIFGGGFNLLAAFKRGGKPVDADSLALMFWEFKEEVGADFSDDQMDADDALAELGLYRKTGKVDEWGGEEEVYGPEEKKDAG